MDATLNQGGSTKGILLKTLAAIQRIKCYLNGSCGLSKRLICEERTPPSKAILSQQLTEH